MNSFSLFTVGINYSSPKVCLNTQLNILSGTKVHRRQQIELFWVNSPSTNFSFQNFQCKMQLVCLCASLLNSLSFRKQENASNNTQQCWTFHVVSSHLGGKQEEAALAIKTFLNSNCGPIDEISINCDSARLITFENCSECNCLLIMFRSNFLLKLFLHNLT